MRIIAFIISSIFHPAFIPLIGFLLLYNLTGYALYLPQSIFWFAILTIVQFTILVPVGSTYYLYWRKYISSVKLSNRAERPLPLTINLISYSINFAMFYYLNFPHIIINYFASIAIISALSMVISLYYKISLHMMAWGTLTGVILAFSLSIGLELHFLLSIIIVLTAIIASARLWLNEHTFPQVLYAWLSSSLLSFIVMKFL